MDELLNADVNSVNNVVNSVVNSLVNSVVNNSITDFYNKHKNIDFEKLNLLLVYMFENINFDNKKITNETELIYEAFNILLSKGKNVIPEIMNTHNSKENNMEIILSKIFPTDYVNNSNNSHIILKRENKPVIFIKNEENLLNIDNETVNSFMETLKENNASGIFFSQYSGIVNKPNFHIDMYSGNVILYIQHCHYDYEKIKNAIEIFDTIHKNLTYELTDIMINKKLLNDIYQEYQDFNNYKNSLIKLIQSNNNNTINYTKNLNCDKLHTYLSNHFTLNNKINSHTCDICNIYISNTLKGIAAHKKGCKKKMCIVVN